MLDQLLAWLDAVSAGWLKHLYERDDNSGSLLLRLDDMRLARMPAAQMRATLTALVELVEQADARSTRLRLPRARLAGLGDMFEQWNLAGHEEITNAVRALLRLRQICCDPRLVKGLDPAGKASSAKLELLRQMLPEAVEEGRRILVFSQFTSMLALIEAELAEMGIAFVKLTGRTRDRERPVRRFQEGQVPVFLISLKAGGAGLNLTAADTVIHYDPWWNPAVEDQATGRAHRIGQAERVFSWRLITTGSVEERVMQLQQNKRQLIEGLFSQGSAAKVDTKALEALFAPHQASA